MEKNKMTPAPWVAGGTYPCKGNEGYIFDTSRPEILVCKTFGSIDENSPSIGEQAANSKAIVTAVNCTYGASINPASVKELYDCLRECVEEILLDFPDDHLLKSRYQKALKKAKL